MPIAHWPRPIAIIGMACRVPGARSLHSFWRNLCAGIESVHFFTETESRHAGVPDAVLRDPHYVNAAPVLEDYDCFDASFFHCSPREAALLDPQHRHFMECAWEALEDAGCDPFRFPGEIGLFAGAGGSVSSYLFALADHFRDHVGSTASVPHLANDKDFLTTRVSYKLNLRGPSVNVQTACSTSLAAVHLACRSLLDGESEVALAGGVSVRVPHLVGYFAREGDVLSPDGHCRPFDARACGTLFGSGVGVVVLKPLDRALADRDHIYALVLGSALNNDGGDKLSYTASSADGQERCIRAAFATAQVEPATIGYVEAHGTATVLGDPIEIDALNRVFGQAGHCGIGSVKANIGHLEAAAGIIGFIKAALALKYGRVPPSINCSAPNPRIHFEAGPFFVQQQASEWLQSCHPRRAAVNSLGIGGTNAYAILQEPPPLPSATGADRGLHLLCLSAHRDELLSELVKRYLELLEAQPLGSWADICHTANTCRAYLDRRLTVLAESAIEAAQHLREFMAGRATANLWAGSTEGQQQAQQKFSVQQRPASNDIAAWSKLLAQAAQSFVRGKDIDWKSLEFGLPPRRKLPLPTYPFRRDRHWIERRRTETTKVPAILLGLPRCSPVSDEISFETPLAVSLFPFLSDHRIFGRFVIPGAAYLAMLLTSAPTSWSRPLSDIEFTRPLIFSEDQTFTLQLLLDGNEINGKRFQIFSRNDREQWVKHAFGYLLTQSTRSPEPAPDRNALKNSGRELSGMEVYEIVRKVGLELGTAFQTVRRCWLGEDTIGELCVPAALQDEWDRYFIHPAMLDGCFQLVISALAAGKNAKQLYLPLHIERMVWHRPPGRAFFCRARIRSDGNEETVKADLALFDETAMLAEIDGFTLKRATRAALLNVRPRRPPNLIDEISTKLLASDVFRVESGQMLAVPDGPLRLSTGRRGTIDGLRLDLIDLYPLQPAEVQIAVTHAGLNFRDVLNALGLYPGDPGDFGMECAGTVHAIGAGVEGFRVGDAVLALAPGSLASFVTTPAEFVVRKPYNLTFAEAAAVPVVFTTAELVLARLAKVRSGECVLIHAAAGGVGWAALQIARRIGAEIYCTAHRNKWDYLRALGIEHIFDSRSLDFAKAIREQTNGRGVDVVINSLAGDFIPVSLDVVASRGRFIEIGKQGIWTRERIAQKRPDVAYHIVALDEMMVQSPAQVGAVLRDVVHTLAMGTVGPPPLAAVPLAYAPSAFRRMQQGRHVGKIVIQLPGPREPIRSDANGSRFLAQVSSVSSVPARTMTLVRELTASPPFEHRPLLAAHLKNRVMNVLELGREHELDERRPLVDLGLDSLLALELLLDLQAEFKGVLVLPRTLLFDHPTLQDLVDYLADRLNAIDESTVRTLNENSNA